MWKHYNFHLDDMAVTQNLPVVELQTSTSLGIVSGEDDIIAALEANGTVDVWDRLSQQVLTLFLTEKNTFQVLTQDQHHEMDKVSDSILQNYTGIETASAESVAKSADIADEIIRRVNS